MAEEKLSRQELLQEIWFTHELYRIVEGHQYLEGAELFLRKYPQDSGLIRQFVEVLVRLYRSAKKEQELEEAILGTGELTEEEKRTLRTFWRAQFFSPKEPHNLEGLMRLLDEENEISSD